VNLADIEEGFFLELGEIRKVSSAVGKMHVSQSRVGRRPISVENLLDRDREGTLLRSHIKPPPIEEEKKASSFGTPVVAYASADTDLPAVAKKPRKKFELPSREDVEYYTVGDRRSDQATIPGSGTQLVDIGTTATPGGEHR